MLGALDQGYQRAEIIKLFGVSRATIKRYLKQRRETGQLKRKPIPGRPPKESASLRVGLVAQLEAHPDATLEMHCQLWEQTSGMRVSTSTMSRVIRRLGWTRKKKTIGATERDEEARAAWREQCKELDATKLVVLDECGAHIGLTPLYAWAPSGKRAYSKAPRNRGKNLTVIAALTWGGMGESMPTLGSANAVAFEQYIEKILAPCLTEGQIVLMDNLAAHKSTRVEELIQAKGCQLLFLPSYSPDFSRDLKKPSRALKTFLRRAGARTREALQEAIVQALQTVTAKACAGLVPAWWLLSTNRRVTVSKTLQPVEKVQGSSAFYLWYANFERKKQRGCTISSSIRDFFNRLLGLMRHLSLNNTPDISATVRGER